MLQKLISTRLLFIFPSGDIWSGEGPQPDWVETERDHFSKYRDRDEDGYLSKEEVSFMVAPPKYDPANAEAKHLIQEADTESDKVRESTDNRPCKVISVIIILMQD